MEKVTSKDGTTIAFERSGAGPAVILVDGALCSRAFGPMPKLAPLLARQFTVFMYDRRGRGDSGDANPYAIEREIDDLAAMISAAGGHARRGADRELRRRPARLARLHPGSRRAGRR